MFGPLVRMAAFSAFAAVGASLMATTALAQQADRPQRQDRPSRLFQFYDINGDGKVTLDEITGEKKRLVTAADVNGDGKLSPDEFRRWGRLFIRMRATTLFDLMDANGDGSLSADEIAAPSARWFKRYDKNGDGVLTADELPQGRFGRGGWRRGGPQGPMHDGPTRR